jgi:hypothetical protein
MTEYLILSLNRALPLVWEYNRQITFNLTFSRTYGNIPQSILARIASGTASNLSRSTRPQRGYSAPSDASPALGHGRDEDQQAEALQDRVHTSAMDGKPPVPHRPALRESR